MKKCKKVQSVCVQTKPLGDITCALTVILSANQRQILARRTEVGGQYCLRHIGPEVHLNTNKQSPGYTLHIVHWPLTSSRRRSPGCLQTRTVSLAQEAESSLWPETRGEEELTSAGLQIKNNNE